MCVCAHVHFPFLWITRVPNKREQFVQDVVENSFRVSICSTCTCVNDVHVLYPLWGATKSKSSSIEKITSPCYMAKCNVQQGDHELHWKSASQVAALRDCLFKHQLSTIWMMWMRICWSHKLLVGYGSNLETKCSVQMFATNGCSIKNQPSWPSWPHSQSLTGQLNQVVRTPFQRPALGRLVEMDASWSQASLAITRLCPLRDPSTRLTMLSNIYQNI